MDQTNAPKTYLNLNLDGYEPNPGHGMRGPAAPECVCPDKNVWKERGFHPMECPPVTEETAQVKPSNPKEACGGKKLPMHLVSGIVKAYQALAHFLGNVKYGAWNYSVEGSRASTYYSAMNRHMDRWWLGEENDPVDGTPHLANAQACINILIECQQRGNLNDDRPPSYDLGPLYAKLEKTQAEILERYKDRNPRHYTIKDTE